MALLYHVCARQLVDWTNLLISRFLYQAKRATGYIVLGGFVTRIAERLGVFNRTTTNLPIVEGWPTDKWYLYTLIGLHFHLNWLVVLECLVSFDVFLVFFCSGHELR